MDNGNVCIHCEHMNILNATELLTMVKIVNVM
jgi:hypothetical protein